MNRQTLEQFTASMLGRGYDEVLVREWGPDHIAPEHEHPFDARGLVVAGEFWLSVGEHTRRFGPGEIFELARGTRHAERYGDAGATFWAARRT